MTVDVTTDFNKVALLSNLRARQQRGIMVATSELRRYSDPYVRFATGMTKRSAFFASDLRKGLLIYDTPYAHYTYYNEHNKVTTDHNPNARPKWTDYALEHFRYEIERTVQREMFK